MRLYTLVKEPSSATSASLPLNEKSILKNTRTHDPEVKGQFKCSICEATYKHKPHLRIHMNKHTEKAASM